MPLCALAAAVASAVVLSLAAAAPAQAADPKTYFSVKSLKTSVQDGHGVLKGNVYWRSSREAKFDLRLDDKCPGEGHFVRARAFAINETGRQEEVSMDQTSGARCGEPSEPWAKFIRPFKGDLVKIRFVICEVNEAWNEGDCVSRIVGNKRA